ncbi:uncharacterized protein [Diabrotica undecimpunctata]|uniref:uncharacterized protein n=1 Tax=Diabrotica undecimpunctata TaxID=50387 RepID=UPI003B640B4F
MDQEANRKKRRIGKMLRDYKRSVQHGGDFNEMIKSDPTQCLQIHGRQCEIHLDENIAGAADNAVMMSWQGDSDNLIDRFDVRAHLDDLPKLQKSTEEKLTQEERNLNYERYRVIAQNSFLGIPEENFLNQLNLKEQCGDTEIKSKKDVGATIGYNYEDSTGRAVGGMEESEEENLDSNLDVGLEINGSNTDPAQVYDLNKHGRSYGMGSNDFYLFLINDLKEAEAVKLTTEEELEKALFSGRKLRKERRYLKQIRLANRTLSPLSYAAKVSQTPNFLKSKYKSNSRSPSPENSEQITYITCFEEEEETSSSSTATSTSKAKSKNKTCMKKHRSRSRSKGQGCNKSKANTSRRSRSRSKLKLGGSTSSDLDKNNSIKNSVDHSSIKPVVVSPKIIPRYYGRRRTDESSSELSSDIEHKPKAENVTIGLMNRPNIRTNPKQSTSLSIVERFKRKRQDLLNRQFEADKKAEEIKTERERLKQQTREIELRERLMKLRKRLRGKRRANYSVSSEESGRSNRLSFSKERAKSPIREKGKNKNVNLKNREFKGDYNYRRDQRSISPTRKRSNSRDFKRSGWLKPQKREHEPRKMARELRKQLREKRHANYSVSSEESDRSNRLSLSKERAKSPIREKGKNKNVNLKNREFKGDYNYRRDQRSISPTRKRSNSRDFKRSGWLKPQKREHEPRKMARELRKQLREKRHANYSVSSEESDRSNRLSLSKERAKSPIREKGKNKNLNLKNREFKGDYNYRRDQRSISPTRKRSNSRDFKRSGWLKPQKREHEPRKMARELRKQLREKRHANYSVSSEESDRSNRLSFSKERAKSPIREKDKNNNLILRNIEFKGDYNYRRDQRAISPTRKRSNRRDFKRSEWLKPPTREHEPRKMARELRKRLREKGRANYSVSSEESGRSNRLSFSKEHSKNPIRENDKKDNLNLRNIEFKGDYKYRRDQRSISTTGKRSNRRDFKRSGWLKPQTREHEPRKMAIEFRKRLREKRRANYSDSSEESGRSNPLSFHKEHVKSPSRKNNIVTVALVPIPLTSTTVIDTQVNVEIIDFCRMYNRIRQTR